jgi:hypothetical protein
MLLVWGAKCVYRILVVKLEDKSPIGRHRRRIVDNIKMDIQEMEWGMG